MKRFLCLIAAVLTVPALFAAPIVRTIPGSPLQINVGNDASFQIFNSDVPGSGQIYPSSCNDTADMGIFVESASGTLFAPDFPNHTCSTATGGLGAYTAWTPISISNLTGAGTPESPYQIVVVCDAAGTGLRLTLTVAYINGTNFFRKTMAVTSSNGANYKVFSGGDIYLASSDAGIPQFDSVSGSPGGQDCSGQGYNILFIPITPANAYTARHYSEVWSEIGSGQLSNSVNSGCQDNGAALQWNVATVGAGETRIFDSAISFGEVPDIARFRVDEVVPPTGGLGESLTANVFGIGFGPETTFSFGEGVTVVNSNVISPSRAEVLLQVDPAAALGFRTVIGVQEPGGIVSSLDRGFEVTLNTFQLLSVSPTQMRQGDTISALAIGSSFRSDTTFDFGPGVTVIGRAIISESHAVLAVAVASDAAPGLRDVTAIQTIGGRTATLTQAVEILAGQATGVDLTGAVNVEQFCESRNGITRCGLRGSILVRNAGVDPARGAVMNVYVSTSPFFHPATSELIFSRKFNLKGGRQRNIRIRRIVPEIQFNTYIIVVLDANGTIAESDENNNTLVGGPFTP